MKDNSGIDYARIPAHLAVIMDGNGRWAKAHGLPRLMGHKRGVDSVEEIIKNCSDLGVKVLTLYTFSSENWRRPAPEVSGLMKLLCATLRAKRGLLMEHGIRLSICGRREGIPAPVLRELDEHVAALSGNTGMVLNLAFNYGSRQEIADAVNALIKRGKKEVSPEDISSALYTAPLPDPDLVIRTSGEERISNFLLWQSAYSEFYFTKTLWPDFRKRELYEAIKSFQSRNRRFGGLS